MGRITIFGADGCRHCTRTIQALQARNLPFELISITQYPEMRKNMLSLSMRLSTPQVFFNTRHVGGADETLQLLNKWDRSVVTRQQDSSVLSTSSKSSRGSRQNYTSVLERYEEEIGKHPDPVDPRFQIPDYPPSIAKSKKRIERPEDESITLPDGGAASVFNMTETLKSILPISDNVHGITLCMDSFMGAQAASVLQQHYKIDQMASVALMEQLLQRKIVQSALKENRLQYQCDMLYRLQCHHTPGILNSYRVWARADQEEESAKEEDPLMLLSRLTLQWQDLEHNAMDTTGGRINLQKLVQLPEFASFEEAVCELQVVDLAPMNDAMKIAFGVNLYNLMVKYAQGKLGVVSETNAAQRSNFYTMIQFDVGGHCYSLHDWEHGILRGNRRAPHGLSVPFGKKDPRLSFAVTIPDPRIHFGLNCGARSCPPVQMLSADNLEEELAIVAASFCEQDENVKIDTQKRQLHLSKIFAWYRSDFVDQASDLPQKVVSYAIGMKKQTLERLLYGSLNRSNSTKVVYMPYDWSPNTIGHEYFSASKLQVNVTRARNLLRGNKKQVAAAAPTAAATS